SVMNTVFVVENFQYRGNGVGGTRSSRQDRIFGGNVFGVHTEDNVFQIAFTRGCQQYLGCPFGFEVLAQAFLIAPHTGIVHDNGVVDAVLRVINRGWIRCINDLNLGAIGSDGTGFFIHLDGAVEGTVYRVATQQRRPFMDIIGRFGTHNNSAQTKFSAATSVVQQNASQ